MLPGVHSPIDFIAFAVPLKIYPLAERTSRAFEKRFAPRAMASMHPGFSDSLTRFFFKKVSNWTGMREMI